MWSARFIRSFFCRLWSCLLLCATRFARSGRFARFVELPPFLPLGLPLCVLHVLHVLQIPRDRPWTWIQGDESTQSSGEEEDESSDEEEEAVEDQEEEDEEGNNNGTRIKEEEEEPLAQRASHNIHLEIARMAAQPKGRKPEEKPEELSQKKKENAKSAPKNKSKGKKKVEENPKHVHYAVEGEPQRKMPTEASRGEKYQAGAAYDNDVQVMQRTLEAEYSDEYANTTKCVWPRTHKPDANWAWRCSW